MERATEEVLDEIDNQLQKLDAAILEPTTPTEVTIRLRWVRAALVKVKDFAQHKSEDIKFI